MSSAHECGLSGVGVDGLAARLSNSRLSPAASGVMDTAELSRQVAALWEVRREDRAEFARLRERFDEQGVLLSRMSSRLDQVFERLEAMLTGRQPPVFCTENTVSLRDLRKRVPQVEARVDALERKRSCGDCKNDPVILSIREEFRGYASAAAEHRKHADEQMRQIWSRINKFIGGLLAINAIFALVSVSIAVARFFGER